MRDGGWVFIDVLVALAILAVVLGFIAPAIAGLGALQVNQESRVFSSIEAGQDDQWASFR
jgi:hypothetical protein